jgi:hypothetical protein
MGYQLSGSQLILSHGGSTLDWWREREGKCSHGGHQRSVSWQTLVLLPWHVCVCVFIREERSWVIQPQQCLWVHLSSLIDGRFTPFNWIIIFFYSYSFWCVCITLLYVRTLEDGELSPACMADAFRCLGKVARAALSAIARHLHLRTEYSSHPCGLVKYLLLI